MTERLTLLRNHAARTDDLAVADVWRLMSVEERQAGLQRNLASGEDKELARGLRQVLKRKLSGFRPKAIDEWDHPTLASKAARLASAPDEVVYGAIVGYFVFVDRSIQRCFLDGAGIPNDDGRLTGQQAYDGSVVEAGVSALLDAHPESSDALLYLIGLAVLFTERWEGVSDILQRRFGHGQSVSEPKSPAAEPSAAESHDQPPLPRFGPQEDGHGRLQTGLDRLLIQEAVRASANAHGAPPLVAMARAVDEFVLLQPLRVQSYFHLGFVDALMGDSPRSDLPAENEDRWRWYDAGWILGRHRLKDWSGIVAHFDAAPRVRALGEGGEASGYALGALVAALGERERHDEAAQLISPNAYVTESDELVVQALQVATTLLRADRAREAHAYLKTVERGLEIRREHGFEVPEWLVPDLSRRLAHCLRHEGMYGESKARLEGLLSAPSGIEPRYEAMVAADIGLLESGIPRLSELTIALTRAEADERVRALERGLPHFQRAASIGCEESAHGKYPMGLLALMQGRSDEAFTLFEPAVSLFASDPERYGAGGLIPRSRFYAALAGLGSNVGPAPRAPQFLEWITAGLVAGYIVPDYLLEDVIVGASAKDHQVATRLVQALVSQGRAETIDRITHIDETGAEGVLAQALLARFAERLPSSERDAVLLERVLSLGQEAGEVEAARCAIDHLYALALQRVGHTKLASLLEDVEATGWLLTREERDEMRLSLYESLGQYEFAAALCDEIGHRLLASHEFAREVQAADLLERALTYPSAAHAGVSSLKARLENVRVPPPEPVDDAQREQFHVCVAVVGGNETQAQYQAALRSWASGENISIEFIASGWTSNWNAYLADFERLMGAGKLDGVVILRFVRTEFGRAVRKRCEKLAQLGIGGHGKESIRRAVQAVAEMARRQMAQRQGGDATTR